ncbi:hypothetical protein GCM10007972_01540 [Iodidimonas muriae]|uniref:Glycosyl transferase family protein n=1 Tax=Iodidimonas muriae TaxID=261467 RepID=A0ABQ2L6L0_9PROT|nr:glycosyl transferase family protein [Iodidimonas muriae]GER06449.1 hypothetical protein JCM17843_07590 [Kordiimonadales bacterium JCM 17843]GGO04814.1 hypothetical protein GCM10007972_01540 [Iodidimonas muriae]
MEGAEPVHFALTGLIWIVAVILAVSGLDDLFIDISTHVRMLARSLTVYRTSQRACSQSLPDIPQSPIAIFIPAWQESDVIGPMLTRLHDTVRYEHYHVFLGVYPNDEATARAARSVDPLGKWLKIIILDHPGPTSKGDCLNALWRALHQDPCHKTIKQIVLHDAEDVVHPEELKLFNYLSDRAHMIQLPVVPLPIGLRHLVSGHYLDEFAEAHQKDLVFRERFAGGVPCAGVGCAFSRQALQDVVDMHQNHGPFSQNSLTEDYELALILLRLGHRSIFVRLPESKDGQMVIATREYFPAVFKLAVRQKARWLIGIALQAWASQGWPGNWATRYMLMRDRKAILTALVSVFAYVVMALILVFEATKALHLHNARPLIQAGSPLAFLLIGNLALVFNRVAHRMLYATRLYGWQHGMISAPRMVVANFINFAAAMRALRLYTAHRLLGTPLHWEKTAHIFPENDEAIHGK